MEPTIIDLEKIKQQAGISQNQDGQDGDEGQQQLQLELVGPHYTNPSNHLSPAAIHGFADMIKPVLISILGGRAPNVLVKGNKNEVHDFIRALAGEKNYIKNFKSYGLDSSQTVFAREQLDSAIRKFERSSGIAWPLR